MKNTEERFQEDKDNESKSAEQGCGPLVWILIVLAVIGLVVMFAESLSFIMLLFGIGAIVYSVVMGLFR